MIRVGEFFFLVGASLAPLLSVLRVGSGNACDEGEEFREELDDLLCLLSSLEELLPELRVMLLLRIMFCSRLRVLLVAAALRPPPPPPPLRIDAIFATDLDGCIIAAAVCVGSATSGIPPLLLLADCGLGAVS